jgi:outer membrane protein assembly factor BamB
MRRDGRRSTVYKDPMTHCRMVSCRALIVSLFALVATSRLAAADHAQWGERHSRNMVSSEGPLPASFDPEAGRNVRWSVALGSEAHSTPVIAGGRVLMGTNNENPRDPRYEGDRGVLFCLDEQDGRLHWQLVVPKYSSDPYQDWPYAGICSPPTVEGNRVYALSNRGEALCLDLYGLANGNDGPVTNEAELLAPRGVEPLPLAETDPDILWHFNIHAEVGSYPHDAAHGSFLLDGDRLYLNTGNGVDNTHRRIRAPEAPSLIVLDRQTGNWLAQDVERIGPRIFHSTWSSPALGRVNGQSQIIFAGGDGVVYAFKPLNQPASMGGAIAALEKIWWYDCDPEAPKEAVHRYNGNRQVSPSNIKSTPVFHGDRVYVTVGGDLWWGKTEAWLQCIDATRTGDVTHSGRIWSYPLKRHVMSTPAVHEGLVYAADCGGQIHCVDAATGEPVWTHDAEGEIWASTFVADNKIYVGTRRGLFWVLAAGRNKEVLSRIPLGSPISATAVAANGVLYVATMNRLYAVANSE